MSDLYIIIGNLVLYIILGVFLLRLRSSDISLLIAGLWILSAFFSVLFFAVFPSEYRYYSNLSVSALVFVFFCFTSNLLPISKLKTPKKIRGNVKLLYILAWFICIVGILPFFGNLFYFLSHLASIDTFGENYGENVSVLNGFIGRLGRYSDYLRLFAPCLFFYFLKHYKKRKFLCVGLLCCSLNSIIANLNIGSRFIFIVDSLYYFCVFLYFKKMLPKKIINGISIIGVSILMMFIVVFLAISNVKNKDITQENASEMSYSLYGGESFLNFSTLMWSKSKETNGDNTFYIFKYLLGDYPSEHRNWARLSRFSGVPANIFYTYIGDLYMDFGAVGALIIVVLMTLLLFFFVYKANKTSNIYYILWIGLFLRILVSGFTYWPYLNGGYELVYTPLVILFMQIFDDFSKKNKKYACRNNYNI